MFTLKKIQETKDIRKIYNSCIVRSIFPLGDKSAIMMKMVAFFS